MTDPDPDADLRALLADPAPDPAFVVRVDVLVRADRFYAARRRRAWRSFGGEVAGAIALASAAGVVAAAPDAGWTLALLGAALTPLWLAACSVIPPDSAAGR